LTQGLHWLALALVASIIAAKPVSPALGRSAEKTGDPS